MSGTKRDSSGSCSETDNLTKKKKSENSSSDRFVCTPPASGNNTSKGPLQNKDVNVDSEELKPKEEATKYVLDYQEMFYPMENSRQGLIIVNQKFDKHEFRNGAQSDQSNLEEMYNHLNVAYEAYNDLRENVMFDRIEYFSQNIKMPCSVIFISISTHGNVNGELMGTEGRPITVREIVECFETDKLLGIPKVFIIQACKGNAEETRECIGEGDRVSSSTPTQYCTRRADVLIAYSTSEGCVSYRNPTDGSWFIEVLKNCILNAEYDERHFIEILTICTNIIVKKFKKETEEGALTQTPSYCSTLRKFLKFENGEKPPKQ